MQLQKILLAAVVLAAATPASAANFTMTSGCGEDHADKSCTSISLEGEIEPEDGGKWKLFLEKVRTPHVVVALNSPGGSVTAALLIANDILSREYDTSYTEGICYSACTTIWLAGKTRYMSSRGVLGFHQAKDAITNRKSRGGNDAAFEFYARLKLPEKAMTYFFSASPEQLAFVTFEKAVELELRPEAWPPGKSDLRGKKESEKLATRSDQENASVGAGASGASPSPEIVAIKEKINDAQMTQKMFGGAKYCSELDGASFYLRKDDRVVNLEEYLRSLQSLVKAERFNQAKRRPWTPEDAKEREEEARKLAQEDKGKCELVASLPKLEKRLQELQSAAK
jgi:ATP-dependent protease ClpP protease subunit